MMMLSNCASRAAVVARSRVGAGIGAGAGGRRLLFISSTSTTNKKSQAAAAAAVVRTRIASSPSTLSVSASSRRWLSEKAAAATKKEGSSDGGAKKTWWTSAEFWGGLGALAGWGMSGAALYDASLQGPEVISLTMTPVLIVYSTLFARWAWVVKPQNLLLCGCHVTNVFAQGNQLRRALEYKSENGQEEEVREFTRKVGIGGAVLAGGVLAGPTLRSALANANLGIVSTVAAADAGPFTVHFWAPMSKWLISGASFLEFDRPTDKISLPQYTALTLTGFFFSRYALLVTPINYTLCSVNIALFLSSAWHLSRKLNADYFHIDVGGGGGGGGTTTGTGGKEDDKKKKEE